MFFHYLMECDSKYDAIIMAGNIHPEGETCAVYVNNGCGNIVVFGSHKSALQFVKYLLGCGVMSWTEYSGCIAAA